MVRLIRGEWLEWGAVTARLCVKHASVGGLGAGAVLGKALGGSSHAHKCRDHAPYFAHARSAVTRAFAMRMLIDIVGVVVMERARVIGARLRNVFWRY